MLKRIRHVLKRLDNCIIHWCMRTIYTHTRGFSVIRMVKGLWLAVAILTEELMHTF